MLAAATLLLFATTATCPAPPQRLAVSAEALGAETLGGRAEPDDDTRYRVGDFVYKGDGIVARSPDPLFGDLILDQRFDLRHRCGNIVFGPSPWNADDRDLAGATLRIARHIGPREPVPGALMAGERGARPVLDRYVAGASWPLYLHPGISFLGLMHPDDGSAETLIVAFGDGPHPTPAMIMARIPMRLETLTISKDVHSPRLFANLAALREGELTHVVLELPVERALATHARVTSARAVEE